MKKITLLFILLFSTTFASFGQVVQAKADISTSNSVSFYNDTEEELYLAIAYEGYADRIKKTCLVTEGWFYLGPGEEVKPETGQVLYYLVISETEFIVTGDETLYVDMYDDFKVSQLSAHPEEYFEDKKELKFLEVDSDEIVIE